MAVRWLVNLAYMTSEVSGRVPSEHRRPSAAGSEFDIGRFRDIITSESTASARRALMDDFNNDGLLDIVTTSWDPGQCMAFYRNKGTEPSRTRRAARLSQQYGGLNLVQTDFNNDGFLTFVVRGADHSSSGRACAQQRRRHFHRRSESGLLAPTNAITAAGPITTMTASRFVPVSGSAPIAYRNLGNGTFKEVACKPAFRANKCAARSQLARLR